MKPPRIELPERAAMQDYQRYVHELEAMHGWLDVDLVHNCFLLGEEVGELFKAVRRHQKAFVETTDRSSPADADGLRAHVGEEIVDVLNYLLAIANRLDLDLEAAFRTKNETNQTRSWTRGE